MPLCSCTSIVARSTTALTIRAVISGVAELVASEAITALHVFVILTLLLYTLVVPVLRCSLPSSTTTLMLDLLALVR